MADTSPINVLNLPGAISITIDYSNYRECEKTVINPFLESLGMTILGEWYTLDGDSFGPLIRGVRVEHPYGLQGEIFYG